MSIVRWNPFREMETMHSEMNRLFTLFGGFNDQINDSQWMLPVDVIETNDALKLKAALPGVDPQDVHIEINDRVLTVSAERRHHNQSAQGHYQWLEQQYGTFKRSVTLPRSVDTEKIEARYSHGVLVLNVPKLESAKPRRIELKTDDQETRAFEARLTPEARLAPAESPAHGEAQQLQASGTTS